MKADCDDQTAQRCVGYRFVPVIEDRCQRLFTLERGQRRTQDGRHQQQQQQALVKPDAAERGEDEKNDHSQPEADNDPDRLGFTCQIRVRLQGHAGRFLREVVAAERHAERLRAAKRWDAGGCGRDDADALHLDERAQNREREIRVTSFDRLINPIRKFALARQSAMPFTGVIDNATNLPLRQFEREQDERGVGPGTGLNVLFELLEALRPPDRRQARARLADNLGQKLGRDSIGVTNPAGKAGERLTHAANIFGGGYEFESGKSAISYKLYKAARRRFSRTARRIQTRRRGCTVPRRPSPRPSD
jgi:hypothetical protein